MTQKKSRKAKAGARAKARRSGSNRPRAERLTQETGKTWTPGRKVRNPLPMAVRATSNLQRRLKRTRLAADPDIMEPVTEQPRASQAHAPTPRELRKRRRAAGERYDPETGRWCQAKRPSMADMADGKMPTMGRARVKLRRLVNEFVRESETVAAALSPKSEAD